MIRFCPSLRRWHARIDGERDNWSDHVAVSGRSEKSQSMSGRLNMVSSSYKMREHSKSRRSFVSLSGVTESKKLKTLQEFVG